MTKKLVSGNEAVALAALHAGVKTVAGYPGTPSTEVISSLLTMGELEGTRVEWSTNEKVAFEIAAASAIMGYRSLCTMKMSGLNVAYDSIISIAYSGCTGGLVIYVADDPGVSAGMCEQDTRGFALMSDMPMLEPGSVAESYQLTGFAFELSEKIGSPVFVRSVTNVSQSYSVADIGPRTNPPVNVNHLVKDINKYTKAGAQICTTQHRRLIESLEQAGSIIEQSGLNRLELKGEKGGVGVVAVGVVNHYIEEGLEIAACFGVNTDAVSTLRLVTTVPFPAREIEAMLNYCSVLLIAEELEPHLENRIYIEAYRKGAQVKLIGKNDGTFSRMGSYTAAHIARGLLAAWDKPIPENLLTENCEAEKLCAARPITVCAGCPHRGVFMAINQAVKNLQYKKQDVIVTGDIGCTILGMNPPFNTLWTEVSMGASIPLACGFSASLPNTPVIATIGDSTFFHAGIPGLIDAVQQGVNLTVVIMDNGWTAMTGMQVNPGTDTIFQQPGCHQLDLAQVISGLGVDRLFIVDPYKLRETTAAVQEALTLPGVKVILARRECAIQAGRRKIKYSRLTVYEDNCTLCKACINATGCPALSLGQAAVVIDYAQCNGCGICSQVCNFAAIKEEE